MPPMPLLTKTFLTLAIADGREIEARRKDKIFKKIS